MTMMTAGTWLPSHKCQTLEGFRHVDGQPVERLLLSALDLAPEQTQTDDARAQEQRVETSMVGLELQVPADRDHRPVLDW